MLCDITSMTQTQTRPRPIILPQPGYKDTHILANSAVLSGTHSSMYRVPFLDFFISSP